MPNWVYNTLHVHAPDKESLDKFIRKVTKPIPSVEGEGMSDAIAQVITKVDNGFSFWNILRPKKKLWTEYWTRANGTEPENNWYNWNNKNWGCKWDANSQEIQRQDDTYASIYFETPWGAPEGIVYAIGKKFPDLSFTWAWEEEQGFGGEWEIQGDDVDETSSYDIPSSHSDYDERGRDCVCTWYEDENDWFSDCPRESDLIKIAPPRPTEASTEQENK